jgi:hypothetical protein
MRRLIDARLPMPAFEPLIFTPTFSDDYYRRRFATPHDAAILPFHAATLHTLFSCFHFRRHFGCRHFAFQPLFRRHFFRHFRFDCRPDIFFIDTIAFMLSLAYHYAASPPFSLPNDANTRCQIYAIADVFEPATPLLLDYRCYAIFRHGFRCRCHFRHFG